MNSTVDVVMRDSAPVTNPSEPQPQSSEPKFGGFTRFEIELEFVQCLASPYYLQHLATLTAPSPTPGGAPIPLLTHPPFVAYLSYMQYFSKPPYLQYLTYPGPTLKNLELLQVEEFRKVALNPSVVAGLVEEGRRAGSGV